MAKFGGSKNPNYSAVYFPGRYWYAAMSFVYDYGGQIAKTRNGKWVGALAEPKALSGLTAWRSAARQLSRANKTGDEAHPQQALVLLNDPTYVEASRAFATRILKEGGSDAEARIRWAWRQALSRQPTAAVP